VSADLGPGVVSDGVTPAATAGERRAEHAKKIAAAWCVASEGIVETGRRLIPVLHSTAPTVGYRPLSLFVEPAGILGEGCYGS
jgi:hypothetical protein